MAFFTAADIPGKNTFTPSTVPWQENEEEILASKWVAYYGQPVALLVATTRRAALQAVSKVNVTYQASEHTPVLSIRDALKAPDKDKRVSSRLHCSTAPVAQAPRAAGQDGLSTSGLAQ